MIVKISFRGESVEVEGTFIKGEPSSSDYPGSADEFEIEYVYFEDVNVFPFVEDDLQEIEQLVLETF